MTIILLETMKHLRSHRFAEGLLTRIESVLPLSEANKAFILLQMSAGSTASCIPDASARSRLAAYLRNHPDSPVSSEIEVQLREQRCDFDS